MRRARKLDVLVSPIKWNDRVFGVNHLFFSILSYTEFPACLPLCCAVHSSWRARLWPYSTSVTTVQKQNPVDEIVRRKRKRTFRREQRERVRRALAEFAPAECTARSVVSAQASYGAHVAHAVFHTYPERAFHYRQMYQQMFVTYCHLRQLTLHVPLFTMQRWRGWDDDDVVDTQSTAAFLKRVRQLCSAWHASSQIAAEQRTLVLHAPCLEYLDACLQEQPIEAVKFIQSDTIERQRWWEPRTLHGFALSAVRRVVLDFRRPYECEFRVFLAVFEALTHAGNRSRIEELEVTACRWVLQSANEKLSIRLLPHLPRLHRLVLRCKKLYRFPFWGPPAPGNSFHVEIQQWTPHFKHLEVSNALTVQAETLEMLEKNGVNITRM